VGWLRAMSQARRALARNPRLTLPVVALLGLALGAAGTGFSLVHSILLRPLPYRAPERLVMVWSTAPEMAEPDYVSWPDYLDWRRQSRSLDLAAFKLTDGDLNGKGGPEHVEGAAVSGEFFRVLGVAPFAGRFFAPGDPERPERGVVVLSYGLWRRRFGGDRAVVGSVVLLSGAPTQVIGIAPPGMREPEPYQGVKEAEFWTPLGLEPWMSVRHAHSLRVVGRLHAEVERSAAQAEMSGIARRVAAQFRDADPGVRLVPLQQQLVGELRPALLLLMTAMGALLAVACANAANQMLAYRLHREGDFQVRVALGASHGELLRQAVCEGLLLALCAGVVGLALGAWGGDGLGRLFPVRVAGVASIGFDLTAAAVTAVLALACGLLVSLPALARVSSPRFSQRGGAPGSQNRATSGRRAGALRGALLVAEVALALPLVTAAALLAQSWLRLDRVDPGFKAEHVVTFDLSLPSGRYGERAQRLALYTSLLGELESERGVEAAGVMASLPLADSNDRELGILVRGERLPPDLTAHYQVASPGLFAALRIPIVEGRGFGPADGPAGERVAVVSRSLARRLWRGRDPIGQAVTFDYGPGVAARWMRVVGVAGDVRQQGLANGPTALLYRPLGQDPLEAVSVVVRGKSAGPDLVPALKAAVWRHDPTLALANLQPLERLEAAESARLRFVALLLEGVAVVALAITLLGIVSLMSYLNRLRRQEMAIRIALGAQWADVLRAVVRPALGLLAIGTAVGLLAVMAARPMLAHVLFGVAPGDPLTLAGTALLVYGAGALGAYWPARASARVNAREALQGSNG
jgi:predicted permease